MTLDEYHRAPRRTLEVNLPSRSVTPTINTPSTSPTPLSQPSSRQGSPFRTNVASKARTSPPPRSHLRTTEEVPLNTDREAVGDSDIEDDEMADTRPPFHRPTDGRSMTPLLKDERGRTSYDSPNGSARPAFVARRSTFRSRSPDMEGSSAIRKKYTYAAFFLILSLVSFVVQTETAVYIVDDLGWDKSYAML